MLFGITYLMRGPPIPGAARRPRSLAAMAFEEDVSQSLEEALALLDRLGERTRNIYVLFRFGKMRREQIADLYGIASSEVERHLIIAMMELANHLDPE